MWGRYLCLALVVGAGAGCGTVTQGVRVATHTTLTVSNAAPSPELIERHCPFGMPEKLPSLEHGPTQLIGREGYVLEHDAASKIALWVCGSIDPDLVFGDAERKSRWKPDPDLDGKPRAVDNDYKGSGFDRGHMVASEDRVATQDLNDATFIFTNAVPQNGSLNGGQWAQLEAAIRGWVDGGVVKNARMITGGFFYDPAEDDPSTADGVIVFQQIGNGSVAVPTHSRLQDRRRGRGDRGVEGHCLRRGEQEADKWMALRGRHRGDRLAGRTRWPELHAGIGSE
jgi:DNA/RNA endonuclease G (NUC1)